MGQEIAAAGLNTEWLHDLAAVARRVDEDLYIPDLPRLIKCIEDDLETMARAGDDAAYRRTASLRAATTRLAGRTGP